MARDLIRKGDQHKPGIFPEKIRFKLSIQNFRYDYAFKVFVRVPFVKKLPKTQQTQGIKSLDLLELFKPVNELQNVDQTSAWFSLAKGEKKTTLTNPRNRSDKSIQQI